jgi:hypothetical protein
MTITIERRSFIQGVDLLPPQQQRWRQALHSPKDCRSQSRLDLRRAFRGQRVGNCHQIGEIPECVAAFRR